jgi:hypothetical protein
MQALNLHIPQYICRVTFLFCFFKTRSGYVAQAGLELRVLLPQPPECWDYSAHQTQHTGWFCVCLCVC